MVGGSKVVGGIRDGISNSDGRRLATAKGGGFGDSRCKDDGSRESGNVGGFGF